MVYFCCFFSLEEFFCVRLKSLIGCDIIKVRDVIFGDLNFWMIDYNELVFYECFMFFDLLNYLNGDFDKYEELLGFL